MQQPPTNTPEPSSPCPFPHEPVPAELLAWARQTFDEKEYKEGVREIEATGGRSFSDLVAEVETLVRGS